MVDAADGVRRSWVRPKPPSCAAAGALRPFISKECWRRAMAKKKTTQADRDRQEETLRNAERTRQLAERAQAELEHRAPRDTSAWTDRERREEMLRNAERLRRLAEKAQAELDRR